MARKEYGFSVMEIGDEKEFLAPTFKERQKVQSAAWCYGAYHEIKFSTQRTDEGIKVTRIS